MSHITVKEQSDIRRKHKVLNHAEEVRMLLLAPLYLSILGLIKNLV